jgi:hypothetical protein
MVLWLMPLFISLVSAKIRMMTTTGTDSANTPFAQSLVKAGSNSIKISQSRDILSLPIACFINIE